MPSLSFNFVAPDGTPMRMTEQEWIEYHQWRQEKGLPTDDENP